MSLATSAARFAGLPVQRRATVSQPRPGTARARIGGLVVAKLSAPKPSTPNYLAYDIVSSGLGAMVCTSFFVSRGQDPWTALSITVASAVVALALNKVLFEDQ